MTDKQSIAAALTLGGALLGGWMISTPDDQHPQTGPVQNVRIPASNKSPGNLPADHFRSEIFSRSFQNITTESDEITRDHQLKDLVDAIPLNQLSAAIDTVAIENQSAPEHDLWLRLLRRWGAAEPREAAAWAEMLAGLDVARRNEAVYQVAIAWANVDLPAAETWVAGWPEGAARDAALTAVTYEGARTDPGAALQFAAGFPPSQENENLIVYSISQWAATDPAAAWEWTRRIEDPESRAMLESNIVVSWAALDPLAASRQVAEIAPGRSQDDAIIGVAQHWVQRDPGASRQWVMQLPDSQIRSTAINAINAILTSAESP